MQLSCYDPHDRVDPMNRRKLYRDLRPNVFRPEHAVRNKFFSDDNVKRLQKEAILIADTKILNANITRELVLKEMQRAYNLYVSARSIQHRRDFFHRHHTVDNPAAKLNGGVTRRKDLTKEEVERHLSTMKDQVMKTLRFSIFSREKEEEKARILGVGIHSQEGRLGRPHRKAPRGLPSRPSGRGLDAGSAYQAPIVRDLRPFY